jgi:hypothetical protein
VEEMEIEIIHVVQELIILVVVEVVEVQLHKGCQQWQKY